MLDRKPTEILNLLEGFQRRGIQLWRDGDSLRYRARMAALSVEDRKELGVHRLAILDFLAESAPPPAIVAAQSDVATPLSFAQRRLWFLAQMGKIGRAHV